MSMQRFEQVKCRASLLEKKEWGSNVFWIRLWSYVLNLTMVNVDYRMDLHSSNGPG